MKRTPALAMALLLTLPLAACKRGEEAPEETAGQEEARIIVPDTTIMRDLNARLDIDPRLDAPEVQLTSHAQDGDVTLIGVVPSRYELGIAMEVARSTPGVRQVWLDSVRVLSEAPEGQGTEASTSTQN